MDKVKDIMYEVEKSEEQNNKEKWMGGLK